MSKTKTCPKCGGSGELDHCGRCNGSGKVTCSTCGGSGEMEKDRCRACNGSGKITKTRLKNCSKCHGTGRDVRISCMCCGGSGQVEDKYDEVCPNCNGTGYFGSERKCSDCNGTGKVICPTCNGNAHKPSTCDRCDGSGEVEVYTPSTSSSSSSEEGKWYEYVLGLLVLIALCWGGWRGYKWLFGERGGSEVITEAEIMDKWEEHLEKRREAFDDGKPEKEIEAKGLRNYTWDEWQEKFKKEHEAQEKQGGSDKTRAQEIGEQTLSAAKGFGDKAKSLWQNLTSTSPMVGFWLEHQEKRRSAIHQGISQNKVDEMGLQDYTFDEFKARYKDKDVEAELRKLNARLAELEGPATSSKKSSKSTSYKVTMTGNEAIVTVTSENDTRQDAWQAAIRAAAKGAVSAFVGDRKLLEANKVDFEKCLDAVSKADFKRCNTFKDLQAGGVFTVGIEARIDKKDIAPRFAQVFPDAFKMSKDARTKAEAVAKPKDKIASEGAVNGHKSGTGHKASKDSKGIRIVVQGKGRTKDAAVRSAIRQAVWRTVGTWVDSKERIVENREKVIALVETVTEADVREFEVMDTQEQNGGFIVKVRVSVSKEAIAKPRWCEVL